MKLRTVKKHLFREYYLDNNRQVKPAQNSYILEVFSDHKKYRKPLKGLKYFFPENKNIQKGSWEFEKKEWYDLLSIYPYCKLPNKFRGYAEAYCKWYEAYFGIQDNDD